MPRTPDLKSAGRVVFDQLDMIVEERMPAKEYHSTFSTCWAGEYYSLHTPVYSTTIITIISIVSMAFNLITMLMLLGIGTCKETLTMTESLIHSSSPIQILHLQSPIPAS